MRSRLDPPGFGFEPYHPFVQLGWHMHPRLKDCFGRGRPSRRTGECRLNLLRTQGPWGDHGTDGAKTYCPRGTWSHDGGGTAGKDDDDARDVCDSLSRATAGFDLAAPRPRNRRLPTWRTAAPSVRWPCVGHRSLSGTPRLGAQDPLRGLFRRGTHPGPGRREGRRGDDRVLGGAERTRRLADPMAARGGPHHLGPGGSDGPSRAPRAVSRRAARLQTTTRGAARGTQLAVVAPLPPEAYGEAGACPPGRLRGRLLRISPERHDGGCEPVPWNRAKHVRATSEPGGAPCDPRHASAGPDALGSSARGSPRSVFEVQS